MAHDAARPPGGGVALPRHRSAGDRRSDAVPEVLRGDADGGVLQQRVQLEADISVIPFGLLPHRHELALRFAYGGFSRSAIEVVPELEQALDRGLELTPPGGELVVLPTYTAMLGLRKIVAGRGFTRQYWERAA